jgi:hypothetical protein
MLRHSRAMTRHHRQRIINKRLHQYKKWCNWVPEHVGVLSKRPLHHYHCELCDGERFKREKFDWKSEIAQSDMN